MVGRKIMQHNNLDILAKELVSVLGALYIKKDGEDPALGRSLG